MTYDQIDQRLHHMCQLLARINRTYVTPKDDDSHTTIGIDIAHSSLMGRWVNTEDDQLLPILDLDKFEFKIMGRNLKRRLVIPLQGITMTDLLSQTEEFYKDIQPTGPAFSDPMHYEIPDYDFKDEAFTAFSKDEIEHWMHWRGLSKRVCQDVLGFVSVSGDPRIWPHHFDTGIFLYPSPEVGLGIGLAMKDAMVNEAYFYVASYRDDIKIPYKYAPRLQVGKWITQGDWKGAVLPISVLNGRNDLTNIRAFVFRAMEWFVELDDNQGHL